MWACPITGPSLVHICAQRCGQAAGDLQILVHRGIVVDFKGRGALGVASGAFFKIVPGKTTQAPRDP